MELNIINIASGGPSSLKRSELLSLNSPDLRTEEMKQCAKDRIQFHNLVIREKQVEREKNV